MPADRFVVRAYRDGDEAAILDLFARSFPHASRSIDHFDWKYRSNPYGNRRIALAFDPDRRLVGHYSGYPVEFRRGTHSIHAQQIGDTMTDPAVRHVGRGPTSILGRTATEFYRHFCDGQVAFNYGFNVANIQKFSLRFLRSERVEPVTYRTLDPSRLLWMRSRLRRWGRGLQLERVASVGAEFDELFDRASHGYSMLIRRDAKWIRWRYLACPDRSYSVVAVRKWRQLVGWIVYRLEGSRMILGDLLLHREVPEALTFGLAHVTAVHGSGSVEGWFSRRPIWLSDFLASAGFEEHPEPQDLSLMCVPFQMADAADVMRRELYYTWGDSDLF